MFLKSVHNLGEMNDHCTELTETVNEFDDEREVVADMVERRKNYVT